MGIKGAHFFTHSIANVSLGELYQIALSRRLKNQQSTSGEINDNSDNFDDDIMPIIDIDASWVFRSSSIVLENRLSWMMNIGIELAKVGFIVVLVCDGSVRHHTKRSTIFRNSKYKIKALDGLLKKTELMLLQEKKENCESVEEKNQLIKQENVLSTKIRAIDAQQQATNVDVGDIFFQNIKDAIEDIDEKNLGNRKGKIIVIKAIFQADSVIAYRCINKTSDMVMSSDSDLAALSGEQCLAIKSFKFLEKSRGEKLFNIVLYTPSTITLQRAISSICLGENSDRINKSEFAIFDTIDNINIRGLLAVGIGCDVLLSGVPGIGKGKLQKFINNTQQLSYESIMKFYCDSLQSTSFSPYKFIDAINIYVQAFIYEPGNFTADILYNDDALYMTINKPVKLHEYCKSFGNDDCTIPIYTSINKCITCIGSGTGDHIFLSYEESFSCKCCLSLLCKYCIFIGNDESFCYNCYLSEMTVIPESIVNQPTVVNMRKQLLEIGIETGNYDNVIDVKDLYEAVIEKKEFYIYTNDIFVNEITLPKEASTYLDYEPIIFRFDLKNGASFIRHNLCTLINKLDIINLFGTLVKTSSNNKQFTLTKNKIYTVLPDIIVQFAERSRLNSGYRLLKRAVRHAMDPEGSTILSSNMSLIEYNNQTGIHVQHTIKASMKSDIYNVKISFTSTDIIAVSCTCKAGSINCERIICVHILPVILQVSLLLYDGLAEHVLYELANEFNSNIEDCLSTQQKIDLKESIMLLQLASNCKINDKDILSSISINDLLQTYKVGTENYKKGPGPPKDVEKLGPLRLVSFTSPLMMVDCIVNKKKIKKSPPIIDLVDVQMNDYIPYNIILKLIEFVKNYYKKNCICTSTLDECIGYQLIKYRAEKQSECNKIEINQKINQLIIAFNAANSEYRTINSTSNVEDNQYLSCMECTNEETNDIINEEVLNVEILLNEENYVQKNDEYISITDIQNKTTNRRYKCNVPKCTVTNKCLNSSFIFIPPVPKYKNKTNDMLITYYRKKFIRLEWLKRLGLSMYNKKNKIEICNNHQIEIQLTKFNYKDINDNEIMLEENLKLPSNKNDPPLKTRTQHNKRKLISDENNSFSTSNKKKKLIELTNTKTQNKRFCNYIGCGINNQNTPYVTFSCVPKYPPNLKTKSNNSQRLQHAKRIEFRKYFLRSIGLNVTDIRVDLRICNQHKIEKKNVLVNWIQNNGKKESTKVAFDLPSSVSEKINANINTREGKGLGIDRFLCNTLNSVKNKIITEGNDAAEWAFTMQQTVAINDGTEDVHPSIIKAVGLNVHIPKSNDYKIIKDQKVKEKVIISINNTNEKQIKSQTAFESLTTMLTYIIIICNGDISLMTKTSSKLTWYEEWFFFLEKSYSRSISRWIEYEQKYKRSNVILRKIFDEKMRITINCRLRWPKYVSLTEDECLRKPKWEENYKGKRVVMWDNTCIRLPKPLDPEAQRNTYSAYYAGNVGKGAIFIQLCGWMGTHEIWMGAVSDSDYFVRSGILQQQEDYLPAYDACNAHVKWVNILDKGYRVTSAAWRSGQQFVLQPSFAKSDRKFTTNETLRSAAIASDRGANERAVRLSKLSKQLQEGKIGSKSIERLSDLWLTWSFQCNFLYKPVL